MAEKIPLTINATGADSPARQCVISTGRGDIQTPFFMPVGTYGAVKSQAPEELKEQGAQMVLSNAYHLYLRPGLDLLERTGGLHPFMGWDGPILTDSGGYQVFSLAALRDVDDDGVTFKSHLDGSTHRFTPEKVIDIQRVIGSDFMMPLDECPLGDAPKSSWATAVTRTTAWMSRALTRFDETEPAYGQPQYLLCIIQGGTDAGLRRQSAESLLQLEPSGVAIGGLAVGESKEELLATLEELVPQLPADTPRYLMGVGTPADLVRAVGLGVDMFDCVLPTRNARNGQLFTSAGKMNLRNAKFRHDLKPVQDGCGCPLCRGYSRAYLRHLFVTGEVLGLRLATAHNLWFYHHMMADMRSAISEGVYSQWARDFLVRYEEGSE